MTGKSNLLGLSQKKSLLPQEEMLEQKHDKSQMSIGIPKEKINEIFERYKRLSQSEGGFGIGMHIVYMIAKEFGLKINIDSEVGKYTEVKVTW